MARKDYYEANKLRWQEYSRKRKTKIAEAAESAEANLAYRREWYQRHKARLCAESKERMREYEKTGARRERALKSRYGLSVEQFNTLLEKQGHRCAICKSESPKRKNLKAFVVDHCHETGAVRGLLCNSCNIGLGGLGDDFERVLAAAKYLHEKGNIL